MDKLEIMMLNEMDSQQPPPFHAIRSVYPLKPCYLILEFDTGEHRLYDLKTLLYSVDGSLVIPLRKWEYFRQVRTGDATVVWPNGFDFQ